MSVVYRLQSGRLATGARVILGCLALLFFLWPIPSVADARTIYDSMARAKEYNHSIKASTQRVAASGLRRSQAWYDLAPRLSVEYEYGRRGENFGGNLNGQNKVSELSLSGEFNLFNGFGDVHKIKRTEQEERAQTTNHSGVIQDVLLQAATAHILFVQNNTLYEIAEANVRSLEQQNELVRSKRKLKALTIADQSLAETRLAGAQADLFEAEADLNTIREQYSSLVGVDPEGLVLPDAATLKLPDQRAFESGLKRLNPKILESVHRIAAAQEFTAETKGQLWPRLALQTDFAQSNSRSVFRNATGDTWLVSLRVDLPLLNRWSILPRVSEARVLEDIATIDASRIAINVQADAASSYIAMQKAKQAFEFRQTAAKRARSTLDSYLQQYNAGARNTEDVLNVQRDFFQAQRGEIIAKAKYLTLYFKNLSLFGFLK